MSRLPFLFVAFLLTMTSCSKSNDHTSGKPNPYTALAGVYSGFTVFHYDYPGGFHVDTFFNSKTTLSFPYGDSVLSAIIVKEDGTSITSQQIAIATKSDTTATTTLYGYGVGTYMSAYYYKADSNLHYTYAMGTGSSTSYYFYGKK